VADIKWNDVMKGRTLAGRTLPHLLKLPIVKNSWEMVAGLIKDGDSVLDIGANERGLKDWLEQKGLKVKYYSCDIDRSMQHDYYDLNDITSTFDVIVAFEVIEHIDAVSVSKYFAKIRELLDEKGLFIVSTPNVCHPVVFWRDCTHITPFRYDELYGLLLKSGFEDVELFRIGNFSLKKRLIALYYRPLLRLLRMDFAPGIVAVARPSVVSK